MEPIKCTFWVRELADITVEKTEDSRHSTAVWRDTESGELALSSALPLGAICDWSEAEGYRAQRAGVDGRYLVCKVPNGTDGRFWHMDDRATNCGRPDDDVHRCWVRHGAPPNLTVDKQGDTCVAGAGSIVTETWHGFLRDGYLVDC